MRPGAINSVDGGLDRVGFIACGDHDGDVSNAVHVSTPDGPDVTGGTPVASHAS